MMNLHSFRRTAICVAAMLAAPILFGAAKDKQQVQAQLLDHAEFLCANCLFGASDYYYCFAAGNQILVGYQSSPVMNWQDDSKNYLSTVHHGWAAWNPPGQTIPISYDAKHIWVTRDESKPVREGVWGNVKAVGGWVSRAHSKQVKLTRSSKRDIFLHNDQCRVADGAKAH